MGRPLWGWVRYRHRRGRDRRISGRIPLPSGLSYTRASACIDVDRRRFGKGISPALVHQGSRCQGSRLRVPSRGSEGDLRPSLRRRGRRVYLFRVSIKENPGAVSQSCRLVPRGTFISPAGDVAFPRPLESRSEGIPRSLLRDWRAIRINNTTQRIEDSLQLAAGSFNRQP